MSTKHQSTLSQLTSKPNPNTTPAKSNNKNNNPKLTPNNNSLQQPKIHPNQHKQSSQFPSPSTPKPTPQQQQQQQQQKPKPPQQHSQQKQPQQSKPQHQQQQPKPQQQQQSKPKLIPSVQSEPFKRERNENNNNNNNPKSTTNSLPTPTKPSTMNDTPSPPSTSIPTAAVSSSDDEDNNSSITMNNNVQNNNNNNKNNKMNQSQQPSKSPQQQPISKPQSTSTTTNSKPTPKPTMNNDSDNENDDITNSTTKSIQPPPKQLTIDEQLQLAKDNYRAKQTTSQHDIIKTKLAGQSTDDLLGVSLPWIRAKKLQTTVQTASVHSFPLVDLNYVNIDATNEYDTMGDDARSQSKKLGFRVDENGLAIQTLRQHKWLYTDVFVYPSRLLYDPSLFCYRFIYEPINNNTNNTMNDNNNNNNDEPLAIEGKYKLIAIEPYSFQNWSKNLLEFFQSTYKTTQRFAVMGLVNCGNTCYLNAALQQILRCPPLVAFFLSTAPNYIIIEAMITAVKLLQSSPILEKFMTGLHKIHSELTTILQSDEYIQQYTLNFKQPKPITQQKQTNLHSLELQLDDSNPLHMIPVEPTHQLYGLMRNDPHRIFCFHQSRLQFNKKSNTHTTRFCPLCSLSRLVVTAHGMAYGIDTKLIDLVCQREGVNVHELKQVYLTPTDQEIMARARLIVNQKNISREQLNEENRKKLLVVAQQQLVKESQIKYQNKSFSALKLRDECRPSVIVSNITKIMTNISFFGSQEDTHECLQALIDTADGAWIQSTLIPLPHSNEDEIKKHWFDVEAIRGGGKTHRDLNINRTSPLHQLVGGSTLQSITCTVCKHVSSSVQHFSCLSLELPTFQQPQGTARTNAMQQHQQQQQQQQKFDLNTCFDLTYKTSKLEGDNAYSCDKCKKKQTAIKTTKLLRIPNVLFLHLNRFVVVGMNSVGAPRFRKNSTTIHFKDSLDLARYIDPNAKQRFDKHIQSQLAQHGIKSKLNKNKMLHNGGKLQQQQSNNQQLNLDQDFIDEQNILTYNDFTYTLQSFAAHSGAMNGGHYYSYSRHGTIPTTQQQQQQQQNQNVSEEKPLWLEIDDDSVRQVKWDHIDIGNAYLLTFVKNRVAIPHTQILSSPLEKLLAQQATKSSLNGRTPLSAPVNQLIAINKGPTATLSDIQIKRLNDERLQQQENDIKNNTEVDIVPSSTLAKAKNTASQQTTSIIAAAASSSSEEEEQEQDDNDEDNNIPNRPTMDDSDDNDDDDDEDDQDEDYEGGTDSDEDDEEQDEDDEAQQDEDDQVSSEDELFKPTLPTKPVSSSRALFAPKNDRAKVEAEEQQKRLEREKLKLLNAKKQKEQQSKLTIMNELSASDDDYNTYQDEDDEFDSDDSMNEFITSDDDGENENVALTLDNLRKAKLGVKRTEIERKERNKKLQSLDIEQIKNSKAWNVSSDISDDDDNDNNSDTTAQDIYNPLETKKSLKGLTEYTLSKQHIKSLGNSIQCEDGESTDDDNKNYSDDDEDKIDLFDTDGDEDDYDDEESEIFTSDDDDNDQEESEDDDIALNPYDLVQLSDKKSKSQLKERRIVASDSDSDDNEQQSRQLLPATKRVIETDSDDDDNNNTSSTLATKALPSALQKNRKSNILVADEELIRHAGAAKLAVAQRNRIKQLSSKDRKREQQHSLQTAAAIYTGQTYQQAGINEGNEDGESDSTEDDDPRNSLYVSKKDQRKKLKELEKSGATDIISSLQQQMLTGENKKDIAHRKDNVERELDTGRTKKVRGEFAGKDKVWGAKEAQLKIDSFSKQQQKEQDDKRTQQQEINNKKRKQPQDFTKSDNIDDYVKDSATIHNDNNKNNFKREKHNKSQYVSTTGSSFEVKAAQLQQRDKDVHQRHQNVQDTFNKVDRHNKFAHKQMHYDNKRNKSNNSKFGGKHGGNRRGSFNNNRGGRGGFNKHGGDRERSGSKKFDNKKW